MTLSQPYAVRVVTEHRTTGDLEVVSMRIVATGRANAHTIAHDAICAQRDYRVVALTSNLIEEAA